jgi:small subunit ribosomal protein S19e
MAKKIFSQDAEKYVLVLAEKLKEIPEFQVPEWSNFVKSGTSRERPPVQADFWYVRAASILRQLYIKGVVGVGRLRTRYGKRKDRGTKPDEFRKASGKIIRVILQQAEAAGLVEKLSRLQHGRRLTDAGRELLDSIDAPYEASIDLDEVLVTKVQDDVQEIEEEIVEEEAKEAVKETQETVEETKEKKKDEAKKDDIQEEVKEEKEEEKDGK